LRQVVVRGVAKLIFFSQPCSAEIITFMANCMKFSLWTHEPYIKPGVEEFTDRICRYFPVEWKVFSIPKHNNEEQLRKAEATLIIDALGKDDFLVVLDEKGKMFSSESLAEFIQLRANESTQKIVFLIGGAYGVDQSVMKKARATWSLSALTFPHQLVRLILVEQLYRACTILRNEKYHHR
jgi:23S rRNA (pseudouridine1915-N3)-methyltransferase